MGRIILKFGSLVSFLLFLTSRINCSTCNTIFNTDKLKLFNGPLTSKLLQEGSSYAGRTEKLVQPPEDTRNNAVSFCPAQCSCNITITNQLQVICDAHFEHNFPISAMRNDVEILKIVPKCRKFRDILRQETCIQRIPNKLTVGPNFKYLRLLKVLVITDSQVPNIGTRTLWGLSGLRILDLRRNKLTNLIDKNFDGLYSLKELYFDGNQIKSMISASFRHVTQLEKLSIRSNKITDLAPRIFYKLRNLKHLDLSENSLQHIDGGIFQDTPSLETFTCESCKLFKFTLNSPAILPKVHSLFLSRNSFRNLSDIYQGLLHRIQVLDLSHNWLSIMDQLHSPYLKNLNVARNNISVISDCVFCNSTSLQILDIGYNKIAKLNVRMVPEVLYAMTSFTLSGNWINLKSLTDLLHRFPKLENLELAHTGIVNIPTSIFRGLGELKSLNLSQNLLVDLEPKIISHLNRLEMLDLSSNFLMGLSNDFFEEIEKKQKIRMVYLHNNQWKCDRCHIRPILHFLKNSLMYWGSCFKENSPLCLRCSTPDDYLHFKIEDLVEDETLPDCEPLFQQVHFGVNNKNITWNTNSPYLAIGLACSILFFLVILFTARYRHYGVYFTNEHSNGHLMTKGEKDTDPDAEDEIVSNPVVVLDRNSESYVNLKYPIVMPPKRNYNNIT